MDEFLHQPGFLNTNANMAADLTLVLMLGIAALFTVGFLLARKRNYEAHRWVQTSAVILNLILVLWMMVLPFRDFIIEDQGGPRPPVFYGVTVIHALIGAVALPFGLFVMLRGNNLVPKALRFSNYKLYMRTAYVLYLIATFAGVLVYVIWFIIIPNSPVY